MNLYTIAGDYLMLIKRMILPSSLICGLLLNFSAFASAPIIKILVVNPQSLPFTFTSQNKFGNTCTSQSASTITCTINNTNPPLPFLLGLKWDKPNNPVCGIDVDLFTNGNGYYFNYDSTYNGSFIPLTWDGKSNVNATLTIGSPRINGC